MRKMLYVSIVLILILTLFAGCTGSAGDPVEDGDTVDSLTITSATLTTLTIGNAASELVGITSSGTKIITHGLGGTPTYVSVVNAIAHSGTKTFTFYEAPQANWTSTTFQIFGYTHDMSGSGMATLAAAGSACYNAVRSY